MAATPSTNLGFQNFFSATLTGDITASSTDIPMDAIPNSTEGFLVIEPDSTSNREVIFYTSKTALKVVCPSAADGRGQDDTTAVPHSTGATVIMAPVAGFWEALKNGLAIDSGVILPRHLYNPYCFRAARPSSQSITGPATVKMQLNSETYDYNNNFDPTTNYRYTAPVKGIYHLSASLEVSVSAGDAFGGVIQKNGSTQIIFLHREVPGVGFGHVYTGSGDVLLDVGDYVELYGYNGRTGANNFGGSQLSYMSGHLVTIVP